MNYIMWILRFIQICIILKLSTWTFSSFLLDHHYDYEKMDITETGMNDKKYDYYSIMHYSTRTFAKDRQKPTFEPTQHIEMHNIGQRKYLSDVDIKGIHQLYQCGM